MKNRMRYWPLYSLLAVFFITAFTFVGYAYLYPVENSNLTSAVIENKIDKKREFTAEDPWQLIYPDTKSMTIKDAEVNVSIAKTWPQRIQGLSGTPYLPNEVVKLFVFDTAGFHSIWMKDMKYPIDIIWVDADKKIVHIKENATPDSFPEMFVPEKPAQYVIEAVAGFAAQHLLENGDTVLLPDLK